VRVCALTGAPNWLAAESLLAQCLPLVQHGTMQAHCHRAKPKKRHLARNRSPFSWPLPRIRHVCPDVGAIWVLRSNAPGIATTCKDMKTKRRRKMWLAFEPRGISIAIEAGCNKKLLLGWQPAMPDYRTTKEQLE
jgi:hypothetical protein